MMRATKKSKAVPGLGQIAAVGVACLAVLTLPLHKARSADNLSWLHTTGTQIRNERNETMVLGGANLGGWLVEEMWMMPFVADPPPGSGLAPITDHVSLWRTVETRLGKPAMLRVRGALRDSWVTPADFDRIRAAGMNCVRLPFTYDLLNEPDGWTRLDFALAQARRCGLYVILDLHGAPGRQSGYDHTGQANVDRYFKDAAYQTQTETIWRKVALRYRDHSEVAGYDLLNEPVGAPDATTLFVIQDRLLRTIRAVDSRHLIFVEDGYKGVDTFPDPATVGWKNVVLSWHHYNFNAKSDADQAGGLAQVAATARRVSLARNAPVYIGEFQIEPNGTPQTLAAGLTAWQEAGVSWSIWTYKNAPRDGGGGLWGWVHPAAPPQTLDPFRDSADVMVEKARHLRSESLRENLALTAVFRTATATRPLPPAQAISPTAQSGPVQWAYTTDAPKGNWFDPAFDTSAWKIGSGGFGFHPDDLPAAFARTVWNTPDIYLRREFTISPGASHFALQVSHDDDAEIYLNGVLAATLPGYAHAYAEVAISPAALATLHPGRNLLAVHCYQYGGGQYVDVGVVGVVASAGR